VSDGVYTKHLNPLMSSDDVQEAAHYLLTKCPVTHSNEAGGFWLVGSYEDVFSILTQPETYQMVNEYGGDIPPRPVPRVTMPPININPPDHRSYRALLNPYLAPPAIAPWEPLIRDIQRELIDEFAADSECELAKRFAKVFPARITFRLLFGIEDPDELAQVQFWTEHLVYELFREDPATLKGYQLAWDAWMENLIRRRRSEPRRHDIIDGLLFGEANGRPLTDAEVRGAMTVLTLGGFVTSSDATCNLVITLARDPQLQDQLRADPSLIPKAIEESLRLDPPVTAVPRVCARDAEFAGHVFHKGGSVLLNLFAANHDPELATDPDEFKTDRPRNRHFAFGAGIHRCIGSNLARMTVRTATEELLARLGDIRLAAEPQRISVGSATWRAVDRLPITFRDLAPTGGKP
jgi:cytochrome P450